MFILSRTVVRVKAIHPTTDFIGRGFSLNFIRFADKKDIVKTPENAWYW